MYCWPSVHTFVVTQYRTSPNAQYRPDRAKSGTMYAMYFCVAAIGLSGVICGVMPRLVLWRTVMNVVTTLIATAQQITILACSGTCMVPVNSTLSPILAPRMFACCALRTTDSVIL